MKKLFLTAILCALAAVVVRADDVAEAQKQFDLFRQYARTNDEKLLDLFAPDISVTLTFQPGMGPVQETVLPAAAFRDAVEQSLAKKDSSTSTYKDVVFKQEGDTVRLTCTRVDDKTGFTGPFLAIYGKDESGQIKMKAMKFTVPPPNAASNEGKNSPTPTPAAPTPADIPVPKATP